MSIKISGTAIRNIYIESMIYQPQAIFSNVKIIFDNEDTDATYKFIITQSVTNNIYSKQFGQLEDTDDYLSIAKINELPLDILPTVENWKTVLDNNISTYSYNMAIRLILKKDSNGNLSYYNYNPNYSESVPDPNRWIEINSEEDISKDNSGNYQYENTSIPRISVGGMTHYILRCCNQYGKIEIKPNVLNEYCGVVKLNNIELLPLIKDNQKQIDFISKKNTYYEYVTIPWENSLDYYSISLSDANNSSKFFTFICPPRMYSNNTYLIKGTQKLPIKFNEKVSGFKYNYADSITSTLGSAYPFIRRNGQQSYITFNIEGLISYQADDLKEFFDIKENPFIDNYLNDLIAERQYREKVLEFLHSGETMIFSSPTEGNIIVRLSNISLTPNETLDRKIWTFSAQATQVAESTFSNLEKYGQELELEGQYLQEYKETGGVVVS